MSRQKCNDLDSFLESVESSPRSVPEETRSGHWRTRLGVDVGGTFTDLIYYDDETGEIRVAKEPTTPAAPEEGVLAAVAAAVPSEGLAAARYFLHGTTVGLNSLLTRTGAVVGLLATRGFRDVLEMARGDRADPYNLFWRQPEPLVPRRLRVPVTERISASGAIVTPFDEGRRPRRGSRPRRRGRQLVAVAFMMPTPTRSTSSPPNARCGRSASRVRSRSHTRSPVNTAMYERTWHDGGSTAYVRPRMNRYLQALECAVARAGFAGTPIVTRSGGGAMTFGGGEARPFETDHVGARRRGRGSGRACTHARPGRGDHRRRRRHELRYLPRHRRFARS